MIKLGFRLGLLGRWGRAEELGPQRARQSLCLLGRRHVKLFADDTSLFTIVQDPNSAASDLNHDLYVIRLWAYKWRMSFNPDPRKQAVELIFSKKTAKTDHPPVLFNDAPVMKVDLRGHLGVILDPKLWYAATFVQISFQKYLE